MPNPTRTDLQSRLAETTDALAQLQGARHFAIRNGDTEWLREVREALPAALAEQGAASDALKRAVLGEAA